MSKVSLTVDEYDFLMSPLVIRERAAKIFTLTEQGRTLFEYRPEKFQPTIDLVLAVVKKNYPSLDIPFHSRWGHFRAGGVDRVAKLNERLAHQNVLERARTKLDLVITSVLLDAGAGMAWNYVDELSQKKFGRSEGLGLASLQMFVSGVMSEDGKSMRADARGLRKISSQTIERSFQVTAENPLVGVEGRRLLLNNLANALENKTYFRDQRPGNILDFLIEKFGNKIPATGILKAVLEGLGPIWPGRISTSGKNLGDTWYYSGFGNDLSFSTLVPFHKLSQWMTYSLIEPIIEAGLEVQNVSDLTGLAEYRNGGLLLDSGLICLRDPGAKGLSWRPESNLVIEWRALTIHLLDRIGEEIRIALGKSKEEFPLAKALEGGTWWAGRKLAQEMRADGGPPIKVESDGTVF